jgi:hypothetical protein
MNISFRKLEPHPYRLFTISCKFPRLAAPRDHPKITTRTPPIRRFSGVFLPRFPVAIAVFGGVSVTLVSPHILDPWTDGPQRL